LHRLGLPIKHLPHFSFCQLGLRVDGELAPEVDGAREFLAGAAVASPLQMLLHRLLRCGMSHYDANAKLDIYPLHLLSPPQLSRLLCTAGAPERFERALDVGAADGAMSEELLVPVAREVVFRAANSGGPQDPLAPRRGPFGPSPDSR
jgi:hypothetical protein